MRTFIEDYLNDPASALSNAIKCADSITWDIDIDENHIYEEIASPEFRLYEEVVMASINENTPHASGYAVVA